MCSVGNQIGVGKESGSFICILLFKNTFSKNRFVHCCRCFRLSICIKTAQVMLVEYYSYSTNL